MGIKKKSIVLGVAILLGCLLCVTLRIADKPEPEMTEPVTIMVSDENETLEIAAEAAGFEAQTDSPLVPISSGKQTDKPAYEEITELSSPLVDETPIPDVKETVTSSLEYPTPLPVQGISTPVVQATLAPAVQDTIMPSAKETPVPQEQKTPAPVSTEAPGQICIKHDFEKSVWELPTCQKGGYYNNICKICGIVEGVSEEPLPHEVEDIVIQEGNCMEDRVIRHICKMCQTPVKSDTRYTVYEKHQWKKELIDGMEAEYCEWCGVVK